MKKTLLFLPFVLACLFPVYAGDALMPGERVLEITLPFRFSAAPHLWDDGCQWQSFSGPTMVSAGLELAYGVNPWLSTFARWAPGVHMFSQMDGEPYGLFGDLILGLQGRVLGPGAALPALQKENMRLATAFRLKAPLPSRAESVGETDLHLWGTGLEVTWDYVFSPLFYLNLAADFFYFPPQWSVNPDLGGEGRINLPVELKFEMEPHGVFPVKGGAAVLSLGFPFRYHMFVRSSFDEIPEELIRFRLSLGTSFGALFMTPIPFELKLRYDAPLGGMNDFAAHAVTLSGTLQIPF
jgi:hypothetical protein